MLWILLGILALLQLGTALPSTRDIIDWYDAIGVTCFLLGAISPNWRGAFRNLLWMMLPSVGLVIVAFAGTMNDTVLTLWGYLRNGVLIWAVLQFMTIPYFIMGFLLRAIVDWARARLASQRNS